MERKLQLRAAFVVHFLEVPMEVETVGSRQMVVVVVVVEVNSDIHRMPQSTLRRFQPCVLYLHYPELLA